MLLARRASIPAATVTLALLWAATANADEWWGPDKALHLAVSTGISASSYAVAAAFTERRELRILSGVGTSLLLGAAKEGYDALGYGDPSWRDFAWDALGAGVGTAIAYALDCAFFGSSSSPVAPTGSGTASITLEF